MNWQELKDKIYYWDGSWRDIYIQETTRDDWRKWIQFVNENYMLDFYNGQKQIREHKIDYNVILDLWKSKTEYGSTTTIHIDNIAIKCHFFSEQEIENDIDPREIETIEQHDKLMTYLTGVSTALNKVVFLTHENMPEIALISVDKEDIRFSHD